MAKRFTDTDKWKKPLIRSLKAPYKLLWLYILDECDHAGIWQVDLEVAQIRIGETINELLAISQLSTKIIPFDNGEKWFIPDFIDFQYGKLDPKNRVHQSVINILSKFDLIDIEFKPLVSPLQEAKDKDKDKDKDKEQDKDKNKETQEIEIWPSFSDFWNEYDKKVGDKEKLAKKWLKIAQKDKEAIMQHLPIYKQAQPDKKFRKNPDTYLNNKSWNDEIINSTAVTVNNQQNDLSTRKAVLMDRILNNKYEQPS